MNSRQRFVLEGLKQAGWVFVALLFVGMVGWSGLCSARAIHNQVVYVLFGLPIALGASVLVGPVSTLLTFFDISDKQLLVLSCVLIIPYWACLGTFVGLSQHPKHNLDGEQQQKISAKQTANQIRWKIEIAAFVIAALFFLAGPIAGPNYISSGRNSAGWKANAIINNLRQIDAAKNQFTLERKVSPDYLPTEADLTPYIKLNKDGKFPHVGPERYVLNSIREAPCAILDKDWRIRRHGWREGYTITNGTTYRLP